MAAIVTDYKQRKTFCCHLALRAIQAVHKNATSHNSDSHTCSLMKTHVTVSQVYGH